MSAYDCQTLYDVAFVAAEKAVRQCADDPQLRHDVAAEVAGSWRSIFGGGSYRNFGALSPNVEVRRVPDLVEAACIAVAARFREMGVDEDNLPW